MDTAIITVRSSSSRLPRKCYLPFGNITVLEHIIKRVEHYNLKPIVCTSSNTSDHRIVKIGNTTRSNFGKLYCYSFATAFFIYVVVNMMMVLGLLPIVGSPLPILSYGGSSMMAIMFGLGIVMSCKIYKDVPVN